MSKAEYDREYAKNNMRLFSFRLNQQKKSEKVLIDYLSKLPNKRQWIINALRLQMYDDVANKGIQDK